MARLPLKNMYMRFFNSYVIEKPNPSPIIQCHDLPYFLSMSCFTALAAFFELIKIGLRILPRNSLDIFLVRFQWQRILFLWCLAAFRQACRTSTNLLHACFVSITLTSATFIPAKCDAVSCTTGACPSCFFSSDILFCFTTEFGGYNATTMKNLDAKNIVTIQQQS